MRMSRRLTIENDNRWTRARSHWRAASWIRNGRVPGASGYSSARWSAIERALGDASKVAYGYDDAGLDERVVEYPWALHRLASRRTPDTRILDAGSVLNHEKILAFCRRQGLSPLSIVTLKYEGHAQVSDDVRYEFADLRDLPYRDGWFESVVCLSTLEHVGMNNALYGDASARSDRPSNEVADAMRELRRVTRTGGVMLVSVPFGKKADHGWWRILDADDLEELQSSGGWSVDEVRVVRATQAGWRESSISDARDAGYNEPRSKKGDAVRTAPPWVSAAEAVALIELTAI
jgi:SAM-dependent methyltransferase